MSKFTDEPSPAVRKDMRSTRSFAFAIVREARVVARGVEFHDGTTVVRWLGDNASTVVWRCIGDAVEVHGHPGTEFIWDDSELDPVLQPSSRLIYGSARHQLGIDTESGDCDDN